MKKYNKALFASLLAGSFSVASGASVDLTTWEGTPGGNWNVQTGNDSVLQTVNGQPTFFYEPGSSAQGLALSGNIEVTTTGDNDFIGFALGLDSGDIDSETADFFLIDWKQGDQGDADEGLAISYVTDSTVSNDFWAHTGGVTEIERGINLSDTGWEDLTDYSFDLQFTSDLIQVSVDGVLELSITPSDAGLTSFGDGAFAFYNYSQDSVLYSAIEEDVVTPPTASPIPEVNSYGTLLALGLLSLTVRSRRSSSKTA